MVSSGVAYGVAFVAMILVNPGFIAFVELLI
jgi:hypothetical protein